MKKEYELERLAHIKRNHEMLVRLGLAEPPLAPNDDVDLHVEVRPRWPIGFRAPRSTTQQQQLAKRKRPAPA